MDTILIELIILCISLVILFSLWKFRQMTSTNIQCFFCHQYSVVKYSERNSFTCPNCQQYNGFTKDGDYNKPITAQHVEELNRTSPLSRGFFHSRNELCVSCSRNQAIKIRQLSAFEPLDEARYDEEVDEYKRHLEITYRLCESCQNAVNRILVSQDSALRQQFKSELQQSGNKIPEQSKDGKTHYSNTPRVYPWSVVLLRVAVLVTCVLLFSNLPKVVVLTGGYSCCLTAIYLCPKECLRLVDVFCCTSWLVVLLNCFNLHTPLLIVPTWFPTMPFLYPLHTAVNLWACTCSRSHKRLTRSDYSFTSLKSPSVSLKRSPRKVSESCSSFPVSETSSSFPVSETSHMRDNGLYSPQRPLNQSCMDQREVFSQREVPSSETSPGEAQLTGFNSMQISGTRSSQHTQKSCQAFAVPSVCRSSSSLGTRSFSRDILIQPSRFNNVGLTTNQLSPGRRVKTQPPAPKTIGTNKTGICKPLFLGVIFGLSIAAIFAYVERQYDVWSELWSVLSGEYAGVMLSTGWFNHVTSYCAQLWQTVQSYVANTSTTT